MLPSGKHTKNYGKSPFYSWVNQLFRLGHFQWLCNKLPEGTLWQSNWSSWKITDTEWFSSQPRLTRGGYTWLVTKVRTYWINLYSSKSRCGKVKNKLKQWYINCFFLTIYSLKGIVWMSSDYNVFHLCFAKKGMEYYISQSFVQWASETTRCISSGSGERRRFTQIWTEARPPVILRQETFCLKFENNNRNQAWGASRTE